jgi:hypothetical protein
VPTGRRRTLGATQGWRLPTLLGCGACFGLIAAASTALYLEAQPYFVSGTSISARVAAIASGELRPGPSFDSQRIVLDDCFVVMNSLYIQAAPTTTRLNLVQRCAELAAGVVDLSPTSAYAHFVRAVASAALGDDKGLNAGLTQSQRLGPREGWLAQARVTFAESHLDKLDQAGAAGHTADLGTVAVSVRYSGPIIARYFEDSAFRTRLSAIVSKLPEADQSRFVSIANAALAQGGS